MVEIDDKWKREFKEALGRELVSVFAEVIRRHQLYGTGELLSKLGFKFEGDNLIIYNTADYAIYLEFGTYEYWKEYRENKFPTSFIPKKKELTGEQIEKLGLPKGMQPFAIFRRVIMNEDKMRMVIANALVAMGVRVS